MHDTHDTKEARRLIEKGGAMSVLHWAVVGFSLLLTVGAWWVARSQHAEKVETQFERESDQVIELVQERMLKYEDALWAGVAAIRANEGSMTHPEWYEFSSSLTIEQKYPGINGFGVISRVPRSDLAATLEAHHKFRPDFAIHPVHDRDVLYPIVYVEPVAANAKAVGLDIAFETNRRTALEKSRDTGLAQVTGPIVLVQDKTKTPGFLFYAPYYNGPRETAEERRASFVGAVYAPFVMSKLMEGTLHRDNRHLTVSIADGAVSLFDEHATATRVDANPMYSKSTNLGLYGREWTVRVETDQSFRALASSNHSTVILVGGILIDTMLFVLFLLLSRSNRRALSYADDLTKDLKELNGDLEGQRVVLQQSNADLEQFAYVASHDLQEPLRMVRSYSELLVEDLGPSLNDQQAKDLEYLIEGATRMQSLVGDLLAYARVDSKGSPLQMREFQLRDVIDDVIDDLAAPIREASADVSVENVDVTLHGDPGQLRRVLQNLIGNAVKFRQPDSKPSVNVSASFDSETAWRVSVRDNGIGIAADMQERVFQIFQRLHSHSEYEGTGLGLAITKKIVERHHGTLSLESVQGEGSCFSFTLPAPNSTQGSQTATEQSPHRRAA